MKTSRALIVVLVLTLSTLACQFGGLTSGVDLPAVAPPLLGQPPISVNAPVNPLAAQDSFVALYARVSPGVVIIKVTGPEGEALGAGFVYDSSGHVVTNYHVVQDAVNDKVEVDFLSGYKAYGTVIGTDLDSDLAVVKADAPASELHALALGDSDTLSIGQTVIAIEPFQYFDRRASDRPGATALDRNISLDTGQPFTAGISSRRMRPSTPATRGR
jgi:S1-C subfamily serine protease